MSNLAIAALAAVVGIAGISFASAPKSQTVLQPSVSIHHEDKRMIKMHKESKPAKTIKTYKKNEQMSPRDLKALLYEVGFRGEKLRIAWGTAMKESTGRPRSHNKNSSTGDNSYGLFQINMIGSLGPARLEKYKLESNEDLFDPFTNAKIAFQMSNGGKNWSAWHGITERTLDWMKKFPD